MGDRIKLRIGYLPIIDHLILGISYFRDNSRFKHIEIKPVRFHSWDEISEALKSGKIDMAFLMAPLAFNLKSKGLGIKSLLLGHREGLGLVVDKKIMSMKSLEGTSVGIPHEYSTHRLLLNRYLKQKNVDLNKITLKTVAPPEFINTLARGKISGYFGSEPFGAQAEKQSVGKLQIMSRDIDRHHIDCILVSREKILQEKDAIQELIDSLVDSGNFMHEKPLEAGKIGSKFLEQSKGVISEVLNEHKSRVTSWDLLPLEKEFSDMQNEMIEDPKLKYQSISIEKFIDPSFAKNSYEKLTLKKGKDVQKKINIRKFTFPLIVISSFLLIWYIVARMSIFPSAMLPSPLSVCLGALELFNQGVLFDHIFSSLYRVFVGFFVAAFFAIPLGLLLGTHKNLKFAFDPLIQLLRPISPIAWIPLAILWFGVGDNPAIFIIFVTAFFPILLASHSAVSNINPNLIKVARNFGTTGVDFAKKVIIPASFPFIIVGLRISLGISWVIIVAAEMVGMRSGLGFMILDARNFLRTDLIIAGMIIIGIIGLILDFSLRMLENKIKERWGV